MIDSKTPPSNTSTESNNMKPTQLTTRQKVELSLGRRRAAETRFRFYGMASVFFGMLCLVVLFTDIASKGTSAFKQTSLTTDIFLDSSYLNLSKDSQADDIRFANFEGLIKRQFAKNFKPNGRKETRELFKLISPGASWQLQELLLANPEVIDTTVSVELLMDDDVDQWFKHDRDLTEDETNNRLSELQLSWLNNWLDSGKLDDHFNPASDFAAVMTCSQADVGCPFITGAEKRIPVTYDDPKAFDQTPQQKEKYHERSLQIATEMHYVFSQISA